MSKIMSEDQTRIACGSIFAMTLGCTRMTDAQNLGNSETADVAIEAKLPQLDLFARDQPATNEGPADAWQVSRTLVDFG